MSAHFSSDITLAVPTELQPSPQRQLPEITSETLDRLQEAGWFGVGLLVALVDTDGSVLMLEHHARDKNLEGMLGLLSETSKISRPIIEQPMQTLFRGFKEELGKDNPNSMGLSMHQAGGWVINQWPHGVNRPDMFACGISFPVFVDDETREDILRIEHNGEEVGAAEFMDPAIVLEMDDTMLRPGIKPLLTQLGTAGLLSSGADFGGLVPVSFNDVFEASFTDIRLQP